MHRIWFVQQKPFDYLPLRAGLGLVAEEELNNHPGFTGLCPKIYTTRTRPMKGEYYVVEGSRFKAKPVKPRIEFRCTQSCKLDLRNALVLTGNKSCSDLWATPQILARNDLTFPELDLGIKRSTFEQLRDELLRLNKKATLDTPFFVNKLEQLVTDSALKSEA